MKTSKNFQYKLTLILVLLFTAGCFTEFKVSPAPPLPDVTLEPQSQQNPESNFTKVPINFATVTSESSLIPACLIGRKLEEAKVIRVVDGDTIEVELNGEMEKVRYLMVDTPEMNANDIAPGQAAKEFNQRQVEGKSVILVRDTTNRDGFGRLLRFIIMDGVFVNYELVKQGYATTFILPDDTLCEQDFENAMLIAFESRSGIWQNTNDIENISGNNCPDGCLDQLSGCDIKGNISSQGGKIYHLPGSENYDDVVISTNKGERWFCKLEEAIANGWRPARSD